MTDIEQNSYPCVYVSPENHSHSLMRVNDGRVQWNYTTMRERVIDMYDKLFMKFDSLFSQKQMDECHDKMSDVAAFSAQFDEVRQADSDDHLAKQLIKAVDLFRLTILREVEVNFWNSLHVDEPTNEIKSILILTKLAELEDFSKPQHYFQYAVVLMDQAFGDVLISWFDDTLQRLQQLKKRIADNDIPTSDEFERSEAAMLKQFSFLQPSTQWRCLCENGFRVCWKFTKTIQRTDEVAPSFDDNTWYTKITFGEEAPSAALRGGCIISQDGRYVFFDRFLNVSLMYRVTFRTNHASYSYYFSWDNFGVMGGVLVEFEEDGGGSDIFLELFDGGKRRQATTYSHVTSEAIGNFRSVLFKRPVISLHCDWSAYEPLHARRLMNIALPPGEMDVLSLLWPREPRTLELFGDQLRKVTDIKLLVIECPHYVDLKVVKSFLERHKSGGVAKLVIVTDVIDDEETCAPWLGIAAGPRSVSDHFSGLRTKVRSPALDTSSAKLATDPFAVVQQSVETSSQSTQIEKLWRVNDLHRVYGTGKGARIAILDTGVDIAHPDFVHLDLHAKSFVSTELWNAGDAAGDTDDDDDDDVDVDVDSLRFVKKSPYSDPTSHGTHCVGTVGRIAPDATIFVGKIFDARQDGEKWNTVPCSVETLCEAIYYAVDEFDCDVLSMSCGMQLYSRQLENAIRHALSKDVVVVCAAANHGRALQNNIAYPAAFGSVICVGAHCINGQASAFSSAGREIDFLAPGEGVRSPAFGGAYEAKQGTSMATPFVAALAALMRNYSLNFGVVLNSETMRLLLRATCSKEHSSARGYGVLDPSVLVDYGPDWLLKTLVLRGVPVPFCLIPNSLVGPLGTVLLPTKENFGFDKLFIHADSLKTLEALSSGGRLIGLILIHNQHNQHGSLAGKTRKQATAVAKKGLKPGVVLLVEVKDVEAGSTAHLEAVNQVKEKFTYDKLHTAYRYLGFSVEKTGAQTVKLTMRSRSLNGENGDDRQADAGFVGGARLSVLDDVLNKWLEALAGAFEYCKFRISDVDADPREKIPNNTRKRAQKVQHELADNLAKKRR